MEEPEDLVHAAASRPKRSHDHADRAVNSKAQAFGGESGSGVVGEKDAPRLALSERDRLELARSEGQRPCQRLEKRPRLGCRGDSRQRDSGPMGVGLVTRNLLPNGFGHEYGGEIREEIDRAELLKVDEWAGVAHGPSVSASPAHARPTRRPRG